jgi:undecaprenyl-diphosphatase
VAGPTGHRCRHGQTIHAVRFSFLLGAYVSARWLTRWVHTNSLRPFGLYCVVARAACLLLFAAR